MTLRFDEELFESELSVEAEMSVTRDANAEKPIVLFPASTSDLRSMGNPPTFDGSGK